MQIKPLFALDAITAKFILSLGRIHTKQSFKPLNCGLCSIAKSLDAPKTLHNYTASKLVATAPRKWRPVKKCPAK